MAKSSKPTNAFGIDPNSFKTIPNKPVDEKTVPVFEQAFVEQKQEVREEKSAPVQRKVAGKRKLDPDRERKTCHIHFLMQESLLVRVDTYAEKIGKSRAAVIEKALKAYLLEHGE